LKCVLSTCDFSRLKFSLLCWQTHPYRVKLTLHFSEAAKVGNFSIAFSFHSTPATVSGLLVNSGLDGGGVIGVLTENPEHQELLESLYGPDPLIGVLDPSIAQYHPYCWAQVQCTLPLFSPLSTYQHIDAFFKSICENAVNGRFSPLPHHSTIDTDNLGNCTCAHDGSHPSPAFACGDQTNA
jgi:hypothetical protein